MIDLFWYKFGWRPGKNNFGDTLAPVIVENVSGRKTSYSKKRGKLLSIGSILNCAKSGDIIWGTGFIGKGRFNTDINVCAVRGPKTREILENAGVECPAIYGDPAILLPCFKPRRQPTKAFRVGVIPHYVDHRTIRKQLAHSETVCVIDICSGVDRVIDEALKCECILSSSLHA